MTSATAKTAVKTAKSPRSGAEIPLGAHPGNTGGKKGRSGRKPDEFKALCRQLASRDKQFAVAKTILDNPAEYPSLWLGALKWATEHGYGRPTATIEHQGTMRHGVVILPAVDK
jgi:hypothetical protein